MNSPITILTLLIALACAPLDDEERDGDGDSTGEVEALTSLMVGYGEADVTPPVGTPLGGFGPPGGGRVMTGVHDPLLAQAALFVNPGGQALVVITLDATGAFYDFGDWAPGVGAWREDVAAALAPELDLAPEHVLITTSHSHAATDLAGFWQRRGEGVPLPVLDLTRDGILSAVDAARASLTPATLYTAAGELVGFTGRDQGCSDVLDNTVGVLQARSADGVPLVTLVNYAKHPTILKEDNTLASADFVWGLREALSSSTGAPAMYLQGFIAAVHGGPRSGELGSAPFERAERMGVVLAQASMDALAGAEASSDTTIEHQWARTRCACEGSMIVQTFDLFGIPFRDVDVAVDEATGETSYTFDTAEASWHRVGPLQIAVFPGEGTPEYSWMLRARMDAPLAFTVGQGNDSLGYLIDPGSIEKDSTGRLEDYELRMGLGPRGGVCVWEAMSSLSWFKGAP
jgi:hypothetical protein